MFKKYKQVITRGILGKCPNCNEGKLFSKYLKQVNYCAKCNENYIDIKADDGPAWLTILIVAHLLVPLTIGFAFETNLPDWLSIPIWSLLAILLVLIILPRVKGMFIAIIWKLHS
jgi:uncharacterized protein (DUF983 family)